MGLENRVLYPCLYICFTCKCPFLTGWMELITRNLWTLSPAFPIALTFVSSLFKCFIYFWEREHEWGRDRERGGQKIPGGYALRAARLTWGSNLQTVRSWPEPELKSDAQLTEPPRCPSSLFKNLISFSTYSVLDLLSIYLSLRSHELFGCSVMCVFCFLCCSSSISHSLLHPRPY